MGEIKLNRDELEKDIKILDSLNDRVCNILRDSENIGLKLNTIKEVSVSSQRNALSNMQDSLYNLSRKFEDMRDDIYNAVRSYDSSENNVNKIIEKGLGYDNEYKTLLVNAGDNKSIIKSIDDYKESSLGNVAVSKGAKSLYNIDSVDMDNVISNVGQVTLADTTNVNNVLKETSLNSVNTFTRDLKNAVRQTPTFTGKCVTANLREIKPLYNEKESPKIKDDSFITTKIENVKSLCSDVRNWIKDVFNKLVSKIEGFIIAFKEKFKDFTNKLSDLCEKYLGKKITAYIKSTIKNIWNMFKSVVDIYVSIELALAAQVKNLFLGVAKGVVKFFGGSQETIDEIESLRQQSDEFLEKYVPDKDVFKVSKTVIDFGSYLIPYFGAGRAVFETFTGVNAVTGEEMGAFERILSILSVVGVGVLYKAGSKLLSKTGGVLSKISGKALRLLDKGGNKLLSKLEKIFPKLEGKSFNIEKFITENYTKIAEKISKGLGNFKTKVLNIFEDATNGLRSIKNKTIEFFKNAGRKIEETAYKLMHSGADLIRKAACGIDDFIAKAKALVPQRVLYPNGTIGIKKGLYENNGACEKAAEDFISYAKDNLKEVKKVIVRPKYLEKVDDLLTHITENPNVNRNCTFEELCEIYNAKGANPKYTKKEIAAAYYKYTGKLDKIDLIDYQKILKDDGRPVTQAGVKKGEAKNHAHHICYKRGQDGVVNEIAMQGQEILRKYDIDPILDPHNLVSAPNKGHSEANIREVVEGLRKAERNGLKYVDRKGLKDEERIQYIKQFLYKELERLGEIAKGR